MTFGEIILLALAVASTSVTISKSNALEWLRNQVSKLGRWPEELIHCPYCLSHWIAVAGVLLMSPATLFQIFLNSMAVVTLASFASIGIIYYFLTLDALEESE